MPTAWLFGNEAHGLARELVAAADHRVAVPDPRRAPRASTSPPRRRCACTRARGRTAGSLAPGAITEIGSELTAYRQAGARRRGPPQARVASYVWNQIDAYEPQAGRCADARSAGAAVEDAEKAFASRRPGGAGRGQARAPRRPAPRAAGPPRARCAAGPARAEAGKRVNAAAPAVQAAFDAAPRRTGGRAGRPGAGRGDRRRHPAVRPHPAAPGTRSPRSWSGSRTCSSRWAGRSPRAPSSRRSGSTSTR